MRLYSPFLWFALPAVFVLALHQPALTVGDLSQTSQMGQTSPVAQGASQTLQSKAPALVPESGTQTLKPAQGAMGASRRPAGIGAFPARPPAPPMEIAHGKQLFEANCSFCHGTDAMGGESGPNLVLSRPVMHDRNGETITPIVHSGFPTRGMPSFSTLSDADIQAIAAFLHSLSLTNRGAPSALDILVGNAQAGEMYFNQHCTTCHTLSAAGAGSLAGIGSKYSPKMIQNMIVSGAARGGGLGSGGPAPSPLSPTAVTVIVILRSGHTVSGTLDGISPFIVSLTEADGTYRSFPRHGTDPKIVIHDKLMWHINMLAKWKDADIHNLTAYLVTLK